MIDNRDLTKRPAAPVSQLRLERRQETREERLITIKRATLDRLNERTNDLKAVVLAYAALSEQELRCMRVDYVLERARRNREEFQEYSFRSDLMNTWKEVQRLANPLASLIDLHPELANQVEAHDGYVAVGTAAIDKVRNPAQDVALEVAADDVYRSLAGVGPIITSLGETCRSIGQGHLEAIAIDLARIQEIDDARQPDAAGAMPGNWKQGNDLGPAAVEATSVAAAFAQVHDETTRPSTLEDSAATFGR